MSKPNIFWISLESTRFDHTSLSNYYRDTTPNLKKIAEGSDAKSFDRCFAHGIWTRTAVASILSGTYPGYHNVLDSNHVIPDQIPLLPEILQKNGYKTVGYAINGHIDSLCKDRKMFDEYVSDTLRRNLHNIAGFKELIKFLANFPKHSGDYKTDASHLNINYLINKGIERQISRSSDPLFVFAHYQDQHSPYIPPHRFLDRFMNDSEKSPRKIIKEYLNLIDSERPYKYRPDLSDSDWETIRIVYDSVLAHTDHWIGKLVDYIESHLDNTIIVISGDHGEFLGEKDLGTHWLRPHDAVSHIPLIVKGPTQIAEYEGPIQPIDIHTTLLEELDLNYDLSQGFDLRHENREWCVIQSGERRTERIVNLVRDHYPNFDYEDTGLLTAIRTDEFKYEQSEASERLYSLPDESTDITSESPGVTDEFRLKYEEFVQKLNSYPSIGQTKTNITPETKKRLEKMGYLVD